MPFLLVPLLRRVDLLTLISVIVVTGCSTSVAAQRPQPKIDSQAKSVLAACYEAMGEPDESFSLKVQAKVSDMDHPSLPARMVTLLTEGEYRLRREEFIGGRESVTTVNRRSGKRSLNGKQQPLPISETVLRLAETVPGYLCKPSGQRAQGNLTYLGAMLHGGVETDVVDFSSPVAIAGTQMDTDKTKNNDKASLADHRAAVASIVAEASHLTLYISSITHFVTAVTKTAYSAESYQNKLEYELRFSNYISTNGIGIPQQIDTVLADQVIESMKVTSITANPGHSTSDFVQEALK